VKFGPKTYLYLAMVFVFCGVPAAGIACVILYLTDGMPFGSDAHKPRRKKPMMSSKRRLR
jgi:hypothetical protein